MSEPDDLLEKADAFLKRYRPANATGKHDVPVLTEVIDEGGTTPAVPTAGSPAPAPSAKTEFLELERKLQQSIDAHLQRALAGVSTQLRAELEALIRETVARAVASEITRLRGPSRGP
jgi:hypothetical protein